MMTMGPLSTWALIGLLVVTGGLVWACLRAARNDRREAAIRRLADGLDVPPRPAGRSDVRQPLDGHRSCWSAGGVPQGRPGSRRGVATRVLTDR